MYRPSITPKMASFRGVLARYKGVGPELAAALTDDEVELLRQIPPASQTEEGMALGTGACLCPIGRDGCAAHAVVRGKSVDNAMPRSHQDGSLQ